MARAWNGHAWVEAKAKPRQNPFDADAAAVVERMRAKRKADADIFLEQVRIEREAQRKVDQEAEHRAILADIARRQEERAPPQPVPQPGMVDEFLEIEDDAFWGDPEEAPQPPEPRQVNMNQGGGIAVGLNAPWHEIGLRAAGIAVNPGDNPVRDANRFVFGRAGRLKPAFPPDQEVEVIMANPIPFDRTERTTRMPRFKVKYATGEEFKLRLENTIVTVNDDLVFVRQVRQMRSPDGRNEWGCDALDAEGGRKAMFFEDNGLNLRSPDPGYIQIGDTVYHMRRRPARIYKQGLMSENTVFRQVHNDMNQNLFGNQPLHILLKALNERPVLHWDPEMLEGKKAVRLSDRIAVVAPYKTKRIKVEHLGFDIGTLHGSTVLSDHVTMWAERACEQVGLTLKQK